MASEKTAIITGGGSGIGRATAKRFAADGFNVVIIGRTVEKLEETKAEIADGNVFVAPGDVTEAQDIARIVEQTIERFGSIDVVVNNAGVASMNPFQEADDDEFDLQFNTNVKGAFRLSKAAYPHLKATAGSIVNVASVSGLGGDWGLCLYNAAKGAVVNLTRGMALDLARDGIRVNAVAPSLTQTDMASGIFDDDETLAKFRNRIAMDRGAEPGEVADVIAFLASHDARFVTGAIVPVDGGLTASNGQPPLG